ncbi:hypothetical protein [Microbispora sp. NPDC046933]|uniref:hypothetical protein n=1 Tax=Microbispora sp. NPDC046933 TaxID=3155618 RepID=UPI0033D0E85C
MNISTVSAIVGAAAGVLIVKQGNRPVFSACGSADPLEELAVVIDLPAAVPRVLAEVGIAFRVSSVSHPAMRHASAARGRLGVPTVFTVLGPFTNPAPLGAAAIGVADARTAPFVAGVPARRGRSALVFRGDDGLAEPTVTTTSQVWTARAGTLRQETFDPRDLGIPPAAPDCLRGDGPAHNAEITLEILTGTLSPVRDAILLSATGELAAPTPAATPGTAPVRERMGVRGESRSRRRRRRRRDDPRPVGHGDYRTGREHDITDRVNGRHR